MNILIVVDMKAILNNSLLRTQYKTFNYHIHLLGIHELISQKQIFIMTFHVCLKFIHSKFLSFKEKMHFIHALLNYISGMQTILYQQFKF